jgi:hypothetical protein
MGFGEKPLKDKRAEGKEVDTVCNHLDLPRHVGRPSTSWLNPLY